MVGTLKRGVVGGIMDVSIVDAMGGIGEVGVGVRP